MNSFVQSPERIEDDLQLLEAMVEEIPRYLKFEGLYYPLAQTNSLRLTLGVYLMHQHRLVAVAKSMDKELAERLTDAIIKYQEAISDHIVRVEQHLNQELDTRLKQWRTYLTEVTENPDEYLAYYATHVADRAIMQHIFDFMQSPYQPDQEVAQQLRLLDSELQDRWENGYFVWPEVWQPAYPETPYWWLYGRPTSPNN